MDRYSKGVIVEGVETSQEWAMVQRSDAVAAQGYYLSRPASFDGLQALPMLFAANAPKAIMIAFHLLLPASRVLTV